MADLGDLTFNTLQKLLRSCKKSYRDTEGARRRSWRPFLSNPARCRLLSRAVPGGPCCCCWFYSIPSVASSLSWCGSAWTSKDPAWENRGGGPMNPTWPMSWAEDRPLPLRDHWLDWGPECSASVPSTAGAVPGQCDGSWAPEKWANQTLIHGSISMSIQTVYIYIFMHIVMLILLYNYTHIHSFSLIYILYIYICIFGMMNIHNYQLRLCSPVDYKGFNT